MNPLAVAGHSWLIFSLFACIAEGSLQMPSFQPGILYQYRYSLDAQLGYVPRVSLQGSWMKAEALVHVQLLWRSQAGEQLLQVQIQNLKFSHEPEHEKNQNATGGPFTETTLGKENTAELQLPVFLHWNNGKVEGIYGDREEKPLILDLKRGLISLLQFQPHAGRITEEDISGSCKVVYTVSKDSVVKTKDLQECTRPRFGFTSVNKIFGVQLQPISRSLYLMKGSVIQSVLSEESHVVSLTLRSSTGIMITSRQQLELMSSSMPGLAEIHGQSLQEALDSLLEKHQPISLVSQPFKRMCTQCSSLKDYLKTVGNRRVRMDISKVSTTWQFHRLIQMLHSAKKRDVLQLLRKASEKTVPFFIDAAVAAQSTASLVALSEFLDFSNKKQEPLVEKFLYAAAFSPRPSKELLRLLLPSLLFHGYLKCDPSSSSSASSNKQEVELGMETVLRRLSETEEESEMVTYLLSLKNALLPETIPILLNYAEEGSAAVSGTAVSALQRFSTQHITGEVKKAMRRIFHEKMRKYEKTCRLTAAEILLDNEPLPMDITNILLATRELETEMATFLLSKIQSSLHSPHHPARKAMKELLKDPWINNYSYLSKAGISSSFSGPLTVTKDVLFPFTLDLLFTEVGLLRKSVSDFLVLSHGHQLQAAQVTFEAKGLDSVLGENTNEEEEQELMAGMSAIVFDVQLRPVVFFQGYTDLMAKVLLSSGEPTNVIKGNVLLMDHQQAIPLQSGLQAVVELQGGLGIDISANIDVNIWEQESKTEIRTRGGLAIDFQAELDAPFFQASLRRQTEVETALNFATALRFSGSPMLMCLQLNEEQLPYREIFTISETSVNRSITVRKGRRGMLAGRDFALHTANSEMCKILLAEETEQ
ncbi:microsomal triglyceride transfer protein-like isoform X2 [Alligator sinensis]|uniref:Microsomal triglyceride transfer protein-like isoform X2 n=1 Tax=Alligator sinensis TaxID=38654 RepID=A0A3Q0FQQ9_ALLSI|nr:microsomal triglyceride transfer protein-like isoform X2 [Alligator sinensis]